MLSQVVVGVRIDCESFALDFGQLFTSLVVCYLLDCLFVFRAAFIYQMFDLTTSSICMVNTSIKILRFGLLFLFLLPDDFLDLFLLTFDILEVLEALGYETSAVALLFPGINIRRNNCRVEIGRASCRERVLMPV